MTLQFIMNSLLALSPLFILLTFIVIEGYGTPTNVGPITTSMETDRTTSKDHRNCAFLSMYDGCQMDTVKEKCPIACGNVCEDQYSHCEAIAARDVCDTFETLKKFCVKSCHLCDTDKKTVS
ncbi:uncharacterized protein LOC131887078 isoform X3 [Tigriopus californicus]|uniref:uncharacterized protein LOC131887078 isoform X2 n=1 Tax=Tigriopus californicus TaxID=6832 RepID=UPI0027DA3B96|nr:uncharacterized protein LOC131887078 isoform X2 [Tigriopus californicus]XP_059091557.1 uncharacterized protein LOC131887078 isoform X3 [Tigriopus californicus]